MQEQVTLVISRDNVVEETFNQFQTVSDLNLQGKMKIFFIDEEADDAGGVIREWVNILIDKLFAEGQGLFEIKQNDNEQFYIPSKNAPIDMMAFTGQILGKALFEGIPISAKISSLFLKQLTEESPTLEDLQDYDPEVYNSLLFVQENDPEDLCLTFTVMEDGEEVELIEGGANEYVTEDNKETFILAMLGYYSMERAKDQTLALFNGFQSVVRSEFLTVFDSEELDRLMFGQKEIDLDDWKNNTFYKGAYTQEGSSNKIVKWFWEEVNTLSQVELR